MAGIRFEGIDELIADLEKVTDLSGDAMESMLDAEAAVVTKAHKKELESLGLRRTGQLIASVAEGNRSQRGFSHEIDVWPQGTRSNGVRNAEVGFILEYGAPKKHLPALNWMKSANEGCEDEAVEAASDAYDKFLKEHNL
jgi:hypothetical protein